VQDGSVLHTTPDWPTVVGDLCVIGHIVHLEACHIHDDVLVGNGSIVLHRVQVEPWSIVAANSVVLNDTVVPSRSIAVGSPAVVKEGRARPELITEGVAAYVARAERFRRDLRRVG
jgi:carbonic anhydrase/acetyltransferase-like protein (isoleucine patch superfamily)